MVWAGGLINHEISKCVETVFKKNSLKPNTASHNNTSWYTDTGGILEHSPSGGSLYYKGSNLQKIIPVFGGSLLIFRNIYIEIFVHVALAGVAQWIECWSLNQKAACLIPSHSTCLCHGPGPE